jgi:hypothetical protein
LGLLLSIFARAGSAGNPQLLLPNSHDMFSYAKIATWARTTRNTRLKCEINILNGIILAGNVPKLPASYQEKKPPSFGTM